MNNNINHLGEVIRQRRVTIPLTLEEVSTLTGVSPSHLGRVERGERFPSARILRKIAGPLGFSENELFTLAGYLSPQVSSAFEIEASPGRLDPMVSKTLSQEPVEVQRAVLSIFTALKYIAKGISQVNSGNEPGDITSASRSIPDKHKKELVSTKAEKTTT